MQSCLESLPSKLGVFRTPDLSHPAFADGSEDLVVRELCAGLHGLVCTALSGTKHAKGYGRKELEAI